MTSLHNDIKLIQFVIPGLTKPAPYLIRGNPVLFWIPASAGMTSFATINVAVYFWAWFQPGLLFQIHFAADPHRHLGRPTGPPPRCIRFKKKNYLDLIKRGFPFARRA